VKLSQTLIEELTNAFLEEITRGDREDMSITREEVMDGVLAAVEALDPIPYTTDKIYHDGLTWRRSMQDRDVWITAGAAGIATSRTLIDKWGLQL
jgi:hypothetical protein